MTAAGTLLYGFLFGHPNNNTSTGELFSVTPSPLGAIALDNPSSNGLTGEPNDIAYDSVNGVIWVAAAADNEIYCRVADGTWATGANQCSAGGSIMLYPMGICYNAAQNKIYAVTGTQYLLSSLASLAVPGFSTFALTQLDTGRAAANPWRIKSVNGMSANPYNGKILIPSPADDTVLVWNPALDTAGTMVVIPGMTAAFDIVNCPTKSFALVTGPQGLIALP